MTFVETLETVWTPRVQSVLRIVTAYLFLLHGSSKLLLIPYNERYEDLQYFSITGFAGMLELVGGALLILGLFTRPVAFLLSGEMAFAYFMAHASADTFLAPLMNRGEPAVLFCFIFFFLAFAGGGAWSVDKLIAKRE
ncbi:hypothetical protein GCM10011352_23230 [Marinobacterium zhoushanense]|uniref:Oxidoreductase n=1 Tax=Marinobacterium zhoushanense TaxID=1679163 RepID=A0ABQ1KF90_9GAMM|nr:DoxX family protein [Marinobacterium zhoushanense]GGB96465.1 hypothetical protein GCM10011352_23230 [Marinobacterium zhoushanense]